MSFVLPQTYKSVSDDLGEAYAAIRDAIYNESVGFVGETVFNRMQDSHALIVEDPDDSVYSVADSPPDPAGSISNDLGPTWFKTGNQDFTAAKAKSIASGFFSSALRKLNSHSVARTGTSTIGNYYSTYAYSSERSAEFNLFTEGDDSSYFTQEFAELSAQLNVTIDSEYVQS